MTVSPNAVVMEEITDSAELAQARLRREQFDRNSAWFQSHASEVYANLRDQCICVAGQELFVAETASEALAQATAAHPDDQGRFVHYIPKDKVSRPSPLFCVPRFASSWTRMATRYFVASSRPALSWSRWTSASWDGTNLPADRNNFPVGP